MRIWTYDDRRHEYPGSLLPTIPRHCGAGAATGNLVPDTHLVVLMRQHGVKEIWTGDRDFRKFDGIVARDPFTASSA